MSPDDVLTAIQRHRAFSQAKIEALHREVASLERDNEELDVAERVIRRLTASASAGDAAPDAPAEPTSSHPAPPSGPKDEGDPSEMSASEAGLSAPIHDGSSMGAGSAMPASSGED